MARYYFGLATTFHDPALAIVGPDGEVRYAEAAERYRQDKRATNAEPDHIFRTAELIQTYCEPDAEFVVGRTWGAGSARLPAWIGLASRFGLLEPGMIARLPERGVAKLLLFRPYQIHHLTLCVRSSHLKSGANLALTLRQIWGNCKLSFVDFDHHLTHAATACYTSPFSEAACLVVDGIGDHGSVAAYTYRDGTVTPLARHRGSESLGALYMLVTNLCGFSIFKGEEWKVMGLAAYGRRDADLYRELSSMVRAVGLGLCYAPMRRIRAIVRALETRRRGPDRSPLAAADLAHTWQIVFSEVMDALLARLYVATGAENLVLSGGCALNSSYGGRILDRTPFKRLHIPSAPGDDGNALGAAWLAHRHFHPEWRPRVQSHTPYLGSSMSGETLERLFRIGRVPRLRHLPGEVHRKAAEALASGAIVGWVQGRAEFGPRALGNRSILADPRDPAMKDRINALVKFREEYRPFAPAILDRYGSEYFENYQESPYMERALRFRKEVVDRVPAVVHADGTGRVQTVKREWNERFYELIAAFHGLTGIPLVLNTSFNIMGKPIIHSVEDALGLFYTTGMDVLVIEDFFIEK